MVHFWESLTDKIKMYPEFNVPTFQRVTLCQVVIVDLSQNPSLHPPNQTLQITMIHTEAELCHGAK